MTKDLIMYIAYKTTEELELKRGSRLGQTVIFITGALFLTIIELLLLFNGLFLHKSVLLTGKLLFIVYTAPLLLGFLVSLIFKRNVLARSIRRYKESKMAAYAGGIGLAYILLTLLTVVLLVVKAIKN